jgi:galactokinase
MRISRRERHPRPSHPFIASTRDQATRSPIPSTLNMRPTSSAPPEKPRRAFRAPGRVNLIGDHTDYNDGFVLPVAIDLQCVVDARPTTDGLVRIRSDADPAPLELPADGSVDPRSVSPRWGRYVAGVVTSLAERGRPPLGIDGFVSSTVPPGAGLASSAALEVAVALALTDAADFELSSLDLALACQQAEHTATGVPCGIMDQLVSVAGVAKSALLIDCRSFAVRPVPLPGELALVVVHSGIERALVDSAYAERRQDCERVARDLGLDALRDASLDQVAHEPRARHVVSENARVLEAAAALEARDFEQVGQIMRASHASLRDDFEVSLPELDALVSALDEAGAFGARLTGAGFGGCVVSLAEHRTAAAVADTAAVQYHAETGATPTVYICEAVDGAEHQGGVSPHGRDDRAPA